MYKGAKTITFEREQMVTMLLEMYNAGSGWNPIEECLPFGISEGFTEMLVYKRSTKIHSIFVEVFDEAKEYKVVVPKILKKFLKADDSFLMTLGKKGSDWTVLFSNPPYFLLDFDE